MIHKRISTFVFILRFLDFYVEFYYIQTISNEKQQQFFQFFHWCCKVRHFSIEYLKITFYTEMLCFRLWMIQVLLILDAKKTHGLQFYGSIRLYAVILILNCIADYAKCIPSASSFLNSSKDNDGTHSAISSRVIFPFFINLSAVSLSASCLSLLINVSISGNNSRTIVKNAFISCKVDM